MSGSTTPDSRRAVAELRLALGYRFIRFIGSRATARFVLKH